MTKANKESSEFSSKDRTEKIRMQVAAELEKNERTSRIDLIDQLFFSLHGYDLRTLITLISSEYEHRYGWQATDQLCADLSLFIAHLDTESSQPEQIITLKQLFLHLLHDYFSITASSLIKVRSESNRLAEKITDSVLFVEDVPAIIKFVGNRWEKLYDESTNQDKKLNPNNFTSLNRLQKSRLLNGWRKVAEECYQLVRGFLEEAISIQLEQKNKNLLSPAQLPEYIQNVAQHTMAQHQKVLLVNMARQRAALLRLLEDQ